MKRLEAYETLRLALQALSTELKSADLEIFAIEMEFDEAGISYDPALWEEFKSRFPDQASVTASLMLAADFVEAEVIGLRGIDAAISFAIALRRAACNRDDLYKSWSR